MIKLKIKEMWAARSRREKILLVLLTCVGLISGIRLYVFEPIFTWQRACQHMLFQAQQQLRWTEQQQAMLSMMSSAQKDKEEKKITGTTTEYAA